MEIKRTVSTFIQKQYSSNKEHTIRVSVRWQHPDERKSLCVAINVGHTIDPKKWDSEASRVKKRAINRKEVSAFEINKDIQGLEDTIKTAFKKFEFKASIPTQTELRDTINHLLGKNVGKPRELLKVKEAFGAYVLDLSNEKTLSDSTYAKLKTVKTILKEFDSELFLNDITKEKLDEYVRYLINERGLQNTTIKKNLTFVKTFLKYCDNRRLIDTDWKTHTVELKTIVGKNIVFLDMQEFERVYNLEFPENKQYLERARDAFAFQCLTSLRYSDVAKLKKTDIVDNYLYSVTEKTDTVLKIPLNDKAKAILSKYETFESERALPVQSNQKMNEYIKEVCYLAELNQPVTQTYYKGKERVSETFKKYELIGTHTARRTFICLALDADIPPHVVMRITGHSDYKSMQPYIDATNKSKIKAVSIFD